MKRTMLVSLFILLFTSSTIYAKSPMESLEIAVNKLILIASDPDKNEKVKKEELTEIISAEVDFDAVSKRIVSKAWRKATDEQKEQFKKQFKTIMVNTYFELLKNYSNEEVLFQKEQIKKNKYATIDTQIISGNKKIPVRYRMIKVDDQWKIYDFIPEGISLIATYKNNYSSVLRKEGLSALLEQMVSHKSEKSKE